MKCWATKFLTKISNEASPEPIRACRKTKDMLGLKKLAHTLTYAGYTCEFDEDGGQPCLVVDSDGGTCWTVWHDTDRYEVHLDAPLRYCEYYCDALCDVVCAIKRDSMCSRAYLDAKAAKMAAWRKAHGQTVSKYAEIFFVLFDDGTNGYEWALSTMMDLCPECDVSALEKELGEWI